MEIIVVAERYGIFAFKQLTGKAFVTIQNFKIKS
jgi:hypothetical protein